MPTPRSVHKAVSGAGSRGGVVIGTTRSGRPIYQADHESYRTMHQNHAAAGSGHEEDVAAAHGADHAARHFSRQDHLDAADAHERVAGTVGRGHPLRQQSHVAAQGHALASMHTNPNPRSPEKAEKSLDRRPERAIDVLRRALAGG